MTAVKVKETNKYFIAADAGTRPELGLGRPLVGGRVVVVGGGVTLTGSGILREVEVNTDFPIFTLKQEMDVLDFTLQLFISAL